jgi:xanthine dehydrogenase accessory factor
MIKGELADHARRLTEDRVPFVIATVVRARRPTSVRPGDCAVVLADGTIEGFVGGACAESTVRLYSLRALETGEPLLLRLIPGDGGTDAEDSIEGAIVERNPCLSGGSLEIFLEPQLPAARIVVVGSAPIATALAKVSAAAGYDVVCLRAGEAHPSSGDAAVVVASHGTDEERVLADALAGGVPYVALVASTTRGSAVQAALDVPEELRSQLHTPAGLDIGARTPPEIAISILAELVAEQHARPVAAPSPAANPSRTAPAADPSRTATAVDPVCGMEVAVTANTPRLEIDGGPVYFCGSRCRAAYAEQHAGHGAGA